jgi:hypothetical protein
MSIVKWPVLREKFLADNPRMAQRWDAAKAKMFSAGMSDEEAALAADDICHISSECERVVNWQRRTGWTPTPAGHVEDSDEPEGKQASDVRNVRWVAENLTNPEASPASAPSLSAWNMLHFARGSAANTAKFYSDLYRPIMLPGKRDLETTAKEIEDEERLIRVIEQVRKMALEASRPPAKS